MSSSWTDKAGRKYDEEFGANMSKNGNIEIQDDTMDRMEDDDLEAGPDPYKDRIIGGKKRIPAKIAKYPRNECKVCGKTFNGRSKWTLCKSCNDGTHKRCIRPGESLDNYKCQRCDPRRQEVPRARANEVNEESWSCNICEFVSLFKANLKRHMREIHKKTVTEADLILKQMQTARDQRVGAEEERVQDDVQNEERTEVQREERGGEGIQDEGTMEQILDKLGFQRLKEIFQKEEVTKEVFMASSALELKTILDIPFGKIKELKIALEKNNEPGFLCPFCEITFVSAEALDVHIKASHNGGYVEEIRSLQENRMLEEDVSTEEVFELEENCENELSMASIEEAGEHWGDESVEVGEKENEMPENEINEIFDNQSMNDSSRYEMDENEIINSLESLSKQLLNSEDENERMLLTNKLRALREKGAEAF